MGGGGGCHPRDNIALSGLARELGLSFDFFESVMIARERQTQWLAELMEAHDPRGELPMLKVILGKSFKPDTNITVGSPAVLLKNLLQERGHDVEMYDPYVDVGLAVPSYPASIFQLELSTLTSSISISRRDQSSSTRGGTFHSGPG